MKNRLLLDSVLNAKFRLINLRQRQATEPLYAMVKRPTSTENKLTQYKSDTEKNKNAPTTLEKFLSQRIWHIWFCPNTQVNASQNQKSQTSPSSLTTPTNEE